MRVLYSSIVMSVVGLLGLGLAFDFFHADRVNADENLLCFVSCVLFYLLGIEVGCDVVSEVSTAACDCDFKCLHILFSLVSDFSSYFVSLYALFIERDAKLNKMFGKTK